MLKQALKSLQKNITTLLEASHQHPLVTPPSHGVLQRLGVMLKGFGELEMISVNDSKSDTRVKPIFRPLFGLILVSNF